MKGLLLLLLTLLSGGAYTQAPCPPNLGFENGNFENWQLAGGEVLPDGTLNLYQTAGNHLIIRNTDTLKDHYGKFPVISPNGSRYSVKMGNEEPNKKADQLVYTLTVPLNAASFSVIFNYAVVLQNPNHPEQEQPRFTVKVYNETRAKYIECSSFDFIAGFNQPDFVPSEVDRTVRYKPWSSASINLGMFGGERLRLEFTVNDCTRGGHFGYAYFDVVEKCSASVTGNIICPGLDNITLTAPVGFSGYEWHTGNFGRELGDGNTYTVSRPQIGDSFAVVLVPYAYLGCRDTFYTTIKSVTEPIHLVVKDKIAGCNDKGIDLTQPELTKGSSTPLQFDYFTDATATNHVANANNITASGSYYIQATNIVGCVQIREVAITISPVPDFEVKEPPITSFPAGLNLTTLPDNRQLSYTYWEDAALTRPVANPLQVNAGGMYYIKGTSMAGCSAIRSVAVKMKPFVFVPNAFTPNHDGKNDRFNYKSPGGLKSLVSFTVFDRWGQEIFSTNEAERGWDGTFKGKPVDSGVYVWTLAAIDWFDKPFQAKGTVALIR